MNDQIKNKLAHNARIIEYLCLRIFNLENCHDFKELDKIRKDAELNTQFVEENENGKVKNDI